MTLKQKFAGLPFFIRTCYGLRQPFPDRRYQRKCPSDHLESSLQQPLSRPRFLYSHSSSSSRIVALPQIEAFYKISYLKHFTRPPIRDFARISCIHSPQVWSNQIHSTSTFSACENPPLSSLHLCLMPDFLDAISSFLLNHIHHHKRDDWPCRNGHVVTFAWRTRFGLAPNQ